MDNKEQLPKNKLDERLETMRLLERAYSRIGQTTRANNMRQRREDLEFLANEVLPKNDEKGKG